MKLTDAIAELAELPYTTPNKGTFFYNFVLNHNIKDVLELGFAHGCSTCYFAAALEERGGHIDAVDLEVSGQFQPTIEQVSRQLFLQSVVTVYREKSSYTWFLKKKIEERTEGSVCEPCYDLIFIDGPKDWTNDGAAFFMADKLLRPGGFMMFDDYGWSYQEHGKRSGKRHDEGYVFRSMSEQEFCEPQIERLFKLLVMQHQNYGRFQIIDSELALACKTGDDGRKIVTLTIRKTLGYRITEFFKKMRKTLG